MEAEALREDTCCRQRRRLRLLTQSSLTAPRRAKSGVHDGGGSALAQRRCGPAVSVRNRQSARYIEALSIGFSPGACMSTYSGD